jgi:hypothetical protein
MCIFEVTCIKKPGRGSRHEHITHLGNHLGNWCLSRESVIERIEANLEAFYVVDQATGQRDFLTVVRETGVRPYLRAFAEGKLNNRLLLLPGCQKRCRALG